tara:strand:- start:1759 stop:2874 length:1116 start_codon:yes stop_codon:yes gene_type:complete
MVKLTPGALLNLFKQTPKTNPPSGTIPTKQNLERAALRNADLFKEIYGREPSEAELGALPFVNLGDLVNLGALKDIPYSPGKSGKTTATEMGQAGRPTSPTKTLEGLTKSTGTIETGDPVLDNFANDLMFDGSSPMGGTADTIKGIIDDNDELLYNDYYTDTFRNEKGELMGYRNTDQYSSFTKSYYPENTTDAEEYMEQIGVNTREELLDYAGFYPEKIPDHSNVVDYFKNAAQEYLDDKGLGDTIYLFRQGRLARGPLSFSMSPVDKPNIFSAGQKVDVYAVKKKDIKAIPNLHKKSETEFSYEEEVLADGEDAAYVGSIGDFTDLSLEDGPGIKFVDSERPYTYTDKKLGKTAKIDSEQFLNQLKGDK